MINIVQALKCTHVQRWHIVHATHQQTVADHQWAVWLITVKIWDTLYPTPHNSYDKRLAEWLALTHDVHETITGDMPTVASSFVHPNEAVELKELQDKISERVAHESIGSVANAHTDTIAFRVVKLADLIDALRFASLYVPDKQVAHSVHVQLTKQWRLLITEYDDLPWDAVISAVMLPVLGNDWRLT